MVAVIDEFVREIDCSYKNETYCVRDNGAVKRYRECYINWGMLH